MNAGDLITEEVTNAMVATASSGTTPARGALKERCRGPA
jgi:hypothetical protein